MMVSPLMKRVPSFLFSSPLTCSSASASTVFMCMSNARRVPKYCLLFLSSTRTRLFLARLRASKGRDCSMIVTCLDFFEETADAL